jgi:hypothetical protein
MEEVKLQKQVKDSSDFQEFSNLVVNPARVRFHEQHCDQGVVEETARISASAVGMVFGALLLCSTHALRGGDIAERVKVEILYHKNEVRGKKYSTNTAEN